MTKNIFIFLLLTLSHFVFAQDYFPTNTGVKAEQHTVHAFINANIQASADEFFQNATMIIKKDKIVQIGKNIAIPKDAIIHDLKGAYVYPSFIELYSDFAIHKAKKFKQSGRSSIYDASRQGYYWNDHILSDFQAHSQYTYNKDSASKYRKMGFAVVNAHRMDGIHRGSGMLIALNDKDGDEKRILSKESSEHLSFKRSQATGQSYPTSIMGAIALIKQFYHDAQWYKNNPNKTNIDLSIEGMLRLKKLPKIFDAKGKLNTQRAIAIAQAFNIDYNIKVDTDAYELLSSLKKYNVPYIVPINFPDAYDLSDPFLAQKLSLSEMRRWNQSPYQPALFDKEGISFAITSSGVKKAKDFFSFLRKAVTHNLSKATAIQALTLLPAKILGLENRLGKLAKGYDANFFILSKDLFNDKAKLYEHWVQGKNHVLKNKDILNIDGKYKLDFNNTSYDLVLKNSQKKLSATLKQDTLNVGVNAHYKNHWLHLQIASQDKQQYAILSTKIKQSASFEGQGHHFDGSHVSWSAKKNNPEKTPEKTQEEDSKTEPKKATDKKVKKPKVFPMQAITFPNKAYGFTSLPKASTLVFRNATVWTNEAEGIVEETDVYVFDGKIKAIGKNLDIPSGVRVINAKGKHLTAGIIDEHSHIAGTSINEAGHNSSAEVKMADSVDPDDIEIFRNLAGGVTTIQLLHGSANPIGGQSAILKLKWGHNVEELLYPGADQFIKFALGENVKQSNWGGFVRFPQTRMGVEQVYVDYFKRALAYEKEWSDYKALSKKAKRKATKPRYDIELETLLDIIRGKVFITCHSYIQSEINMLMKVAERFGFIISTFTHILEGYKVADKMKAHGAGASTFSDWWAYKFEVNDAIPYNGPIMHKEGVVVAYNSDDAEMARRLNQEAAKAIKYGGLSQEEAWKFVTLNPAKLLHIDDKVGSIKVGKDADLVLWNANPLSVYAQAEKTLIEGKIYYDIDKLEAQKKSIHKEKRKLINQMLESKNKGNPTQKPKAKGKKSFHCNTL